VSVFRKHAWMLLVGVGWVGLDPTQFLETEPTQKSVWLYLDLGTYPSVWLKDWGRSGSVQCLVEGIQCLVNIDPVGAAPSARF